EIGIRKALGAQPWSIVGLILHESIFITAVSGFLGLLLGMIVLDSAGTMVQTDFLANPEVDLKIALITVTVLVVAGALAGFFPAWKAARIKPIEALKDE